MPFKFNPFTGTLDYYQLSATGAGTGDVVGPASATDNAIARFDSTTGKLIQNSGVTINDNGMYMVTNTSTDNSIEVDQDGNVGTAVSTDGALHIENTGNTGLALGIYSNIDATMAGPLVKVHSDNTAADQKLAELIQDGTDAGMYIEMNGTPVNSFDPAIYINVQHTSANAGAITAVDAGAGKSLLIDKNNIGNVIDLDQDVTNKNSPNVAIQLTHTSVVNDAATYTKTGSVVAIISDVVETSGSITDSKIVLDVDQQHADATGAVVRIQNSGTGAALNLSNTGGTAAGGITFGTDTNLYRSQADVLKTDDNLWLGGASMSLRVGTNNTSLGKITANTAGTSLFAAVNTTAGSSGGGGAGILAYHDGAAALISGARMAFYLLGGAYDASASLHNAAGMLGYTSEAWSSTNRGCYLAFETTLLAASGRSERVRFDDAGIGVQKSLYFRSTTAFDTTIDQVASFSAGDINIQARNSIKFYLDANNNSTGDNFQIYNDDASTLIFNIKADGGHITPLDGATLVLGTTTGTKIGTATTQKLAFYNSTPIIQPSGAALTALSNLGLIASPTLATSDITSGTLGVARGGTGTTTAFTAGSVVFAGASGVYSQDNANLFWDDTNNRLGIGNAAPATQLELTTATGDGTVTEVLRISNSTGTASGRNALAFYMGSGGAYTMARMSAEVGAIFNAPKFYLEVADAAHALQTRLTIDQTGLASFSNELRATTAGTSATSVVNNAGTQTLTNKRITPRTGTTTSSATPTINTDNVDFYSLTALAVDITSFTTNLSGTPTENQLLTIAITGTAARAIAWGASFENGAATLPATTVTTTRLDVALRWNSVTSKWRCMAAG